jgi:hypothetical protein
LFFNFFKFFLKLAESIATGQKLCIPVVFAAPAPFYPTSTMAPIGTFDEPLPGPLNAALFWGKEEGGGRRERKGGRREEGEGGEDGRMEQRYPTSTMAPIGTLDEPLPGPLNAALFWGMS